MPRRAAIRPHTIPRRPRRRPESPAGLFDAIAPPREDAELLEDLTALVALGLLEERPAPDGPVYALTELGQQAGSP
jgi:hypothetical protein